jgi:hypothetical protein
MVEVANWVCVAVRVAAGKEREERRNEGKEGTKEKKEDEGGGWMPATLWL